MKKKKHLATIFYFIVIVVYADVFLVKDGDSFLITYVNGIEDEVRLIGIDACSISKNDEDYDSTYGLLAKETLEELILNKSIKIEPGEDRHRDIHGRLLAYVWIDNIFVNEEIVLAGLAMAEPWWFNTKYNEFLVKCEEKAKSEGLGIWSK